MAAICSRSWRNSLGGQVISNSDGLGAHGAALGVDGVLALHAVILLEHREALKAHLVKIAVSLALVDLVGLVHANDVEQVRSQGDQEGRGQQVVALFSGVQSSLQVRS
eukprot:6178072-Pleurochrysis_carterae.AAC.3